MGILYLIVVSALFASPAALALPAQEAFSIQAPEGKQFAGMGDIACAEMLADEFGKHSLSFKLKEAAANRLRKVTKKNIGKKMPIYVCGKKIKEPRIAAEISGAAPLAIELTKTSQDCLKKKLEVLEKCE
jgi:preprotein translocase subunit SecD